MPVVLFLEKEALRKLHRSVCGFAYVITTNTLVRAKHKKVQSFASWVF